jgi:predicted amidohydrolase
VRRPAERAPVPPPEAAATVRVAAVQFHSRLGEVDANRERLAVLVEKAAASGARVVVLPECAVPGYADLTSDVLWGKKAEPGYMDVHAVAEPVPGPSTAFFAPVAKRLGIYLTVPLIERGEADDTFHNTVVLLGPDGAIRGVHRKRHLWTVADHGWASEGPERLTVVDTEYGRLGLMICYDVHMLLGELGEAGADMVLHSVAWCGPNSGEWFETVLADRVRKAGVALVLANWTFPEDPGWSGYGLSCVIGSDGGMLARAEHDLGDEIVVADVPFPGRKTSRTRREPQ